MFWFLLYGIVIVGFVVFLASLFMVVIPAKRFAILNDRAVLGPGIHAVIWPFQTLTRMEWKTQDTRISGYLLPLGGTISINPSTTAYYRISDPLQAATHRPNQLSYVTTKLRAMWGENPVEKEVVERWNEQEAESTGFTLTDVTSTPLHNPIPAPRDGIVEDPLDADIARFNRLQKECGFSVDQVLHLESIRSRIAPPPPLPALQTHE